MSDSLVRKYLRPIRGIRAFLLLSFVACAATGLGAPAGSGGSGAAAAGAAGVVAHVNGEPVKKSELDELLADRAERRSLDRELGARKGDSEEVKRLAVKKLVKKHLVLQEARRLNVTVTDEVVDETVTRLSGRIKDPEKLKALLKARGLDETALRERVRAGILMTRAKAAMVADVRIGDEEVRAYYEANQQKLKTAGELHVHVIAVSTEAAAREIVEASRRGKDFSLLARERSTKTLSGVAKDGDMGWVSAERLPPTVRKAVLALKVGETSGPVQHGADRLVVRLSDRRPPRPKTIVEARPEIEKRLLPVSQQRAVDAWFKEQESRAKIELY